MDNSNLKFSVLLHTEEVRLRGLYLSTTIDLEQTLIMLIAECFKSDKREIKTFYQDNKGRAKDLSELTMEQKLEVCKKGLLKYYPNEYKQYKHNFISIDNLRKIRNKFAHDKIDDSLSPNDLTKLTVHKLKNNLKVLMTEYNTSDLYKTIFEYRATMQDTLILIAKIIGYQAPTF